MSSLKGGKRGKTMDDVKPTGGFYTHTDMLRSCNIYVPHNQLDIFKMVG